MKNKLISTLGILAGLWLASSIVAFFFSFQGDFDTGNVAIIPIHGAITLTEPSTFPSSDYLSSESIIENINKANNDPTVKAIIFDINSPGGAPVATDEVVQKIKSINKTKIAVIREVGASGAYWIASACDHIFANRMSITGSVGVYGSYLQYSGLLDKFNITYERMVGGKYKDIGSPFKNLSDEERVIYQDIIDQIHNIFVEDVVANRNLNLREQKEISEGKIYLGIDAKEIHLVDELGNMDDAIKYLETNLNISITTVRYKSRKGLLQVLQEMSSSIQTAKFINPNSQGISIQT
ncbi:signal peptide peptidase SppA [Candidatus Woesearchaeota archaeon]|nr:signal peptide peptidase SppA [Candidatus Woesearchaeota archaeon]